MVFIHDIVSIFMAWVMWFTGLPGCGKTTIAERVSAILSEKGVRARILQLDEIRRAITPEPKYTEEERDIVYASLAYMGKLLADEGVNVIIDATANRRRYRDFARSIIPGFAEVFIQAPLSVCMQRESKRKAKFSPKNIYQKAAGEKAAVPGVNVAYEEPLSPEIAVDTTNMNLEESARHIADRILRIYYPGKIQI
ncbi:MAG: putative adenylyl-sulfate kinase [Methanosaeta sp. PtaU1.Bin112]|nr:MAG: putative adenylyl-sulfate kinase [Methanosaeta sp. PtaU1.Bin112]